MDQSNCNHNRQSPPAHVHQWLCTCPFPHVNPFRSPICIPCYKPNIMPTQGVNHAYAHYVHGDPSANGDMAYPPRVFANNIPANPHRESYETECELEGKRATTVPDTDTSNFKKFLEDGCKQAEQIASRHQQRPGFRKLQHLCQRMKLDLSRSGTTESHIHSQGVPWVTKDFICAYMRMVSCWNGLQGYQLLQPGTLDAVNNEIDDDFKSCYGQWENSSKKMAEHFVRIFTNLDQNVSNKHGLHCNRMVRMMPDHHPLPELPMCRPTALIPARVNHNTRMQREQGVDLRPFSSPMQSLRIMANEPPRRSNGQFEAVARNRKFEEEWCGTQKVGLIKNRVCRKTFEPLVETKSKNSSPEVDSSKQFEPIDTELEDILLGQVDSALEISFEMVVVSTKTQIVNSQKLNIQLLFATPLFGVAKVQEATLGTELMRTGSCLTLITDEVESSCEEEVALSNFEIIKDDAEVKEEDEVEEIENPYVAEATTNESTLNNAEHSHETITPIGIYSLAVFTILWVLYICCFAYLAGTLIKTGVVDTADNSHLVSLNNSTNIHLVAFD